MLRPSSQAQSPRPSTPLPPPRLFPMPEPTPPQFIPVSQSYKTGVPIVFDLGTWHTRVGFSTEESPHLDIPTQISKYRDRKLLRTYTLIGSDANFDANTRAAAKSPFDGNVVSNWDYLEQVFDYAFVKMGVSSQDKIDNPIIISELLATPVAQHKGIQEMLFETYGVPGAAFGIDSLFSYYQNNGNTGLVVSATHESTHVVPVVNGKGILSQAKRLNWGGHLASSYLLNLIQLKYPTFPGRITPLQAEMLIKEHCYVAADGYGNEVEKFLVRDDDFDSRNHIIQAPYTEIVQPVKSEEELARIAARKKEAGRRLQEQAAKSRLEKLIKKEQELEYYKQIESKSEQVTQKEFKKLLDAEGFSDDSKLAKTIRDLEKSIKRSRKQDVGEEDSDSELQTFPLLEILDEELDESQIRQKRHQRLMKSNYDARMRAKAEKNAERARVEEEEKKDEEWRTRDLEGWVKVRRDEREQVLKRIKEKKRLREDLNNRKSHASQLRMKSIANLASDSPSGGRKRRRGGGDDEDTFGANDDDWAVYRDIANASDTEEDEEMTERVRKLEEDLLTYDADFTLDNSEDDWSSSLLHTFVRGTRPFDPTSRAEAHQFHLNIERIRVPEVIFQPLMAGIDQAGVVEIATDTILRRLPTEQGLKVCKDVFLTGGFSLVPEFDVRMRRELQAVLPVDTEFKVRKAADCILDTWKGMRKWALRDDFESKMVTRKEYEEFGPEYIKEHELGNVLA
ncbi:hypothetical protein V1514DRAFT_308648 [Lipomyces japonicus]|uniref:uncharacterized protein n=1 Tax=Lipomyces japonicus TaxID=56871 RepID=UPI0034CDC149